MALRMASNRPPQLARLLEGVPNTQYRVARRGDKGAAPIYTL